MSGLLFKMTLLVVLYGTIWLAAFFGGRALTKQLVDGPIPKLGKGQGRVKCYDRSKGFGIIHAYDNGADVPVHAYAVVEAGLSRLTEFDILSFNVTTRGGALVAENLRLLHPGSNPW